VFIQGGERKKLKIQPAGWRVSQEDTACWSALLSIIKAFKFIKQSLNSYKRINLYTSSIGAIKRLCNTLRKPAGRGLSIAFTAVLEDLFNSFPHVKVHVMGFHKSRTLLPCHHIYWENCLKCNYSVIAEDTNKSRFFGGKITFP
jgi:hypothetical protein